MTRELKLALIVGVTLVLGVAILVSDHLATKRRPKTMTDVAVQPAMAPPPAAAEPARVAEPAPSPPGPTEVAANDTAENSITNIAQRTRVSGDSHEQLVSEVQKRGGTVEAGEIKLPKPMLNTWPTSPYGDSDAPSAAVAGKTHTVAEGDSAYKIAKLYLGDGGQWKKIIDANPKAFGEGGQIKVGTKLTIPAVDPTKTKTTPGVKSAPEPVLTRIDSTKTPSTKILPDRTDLAKADTSKVGKGGKPGKATYTVKSGDTLSSIARRQLGNPQRAEEIVKLNRSVIKDPDSLPLGMAIVLPEG